MKITGHIVVVLTVLSLILACGQRNATRSVPTNAGAGDGRSGVQTSGGIGAGNGSPVPGTQNAPTRIVVPSQGARSSGQPRSQPTNPVSSPAHFSGREGSYLMQSGLGVRVVPTVPAIGLLQDGLSTENSVRAEFQLVDGFFRALADGKIEKSAFLPGHADYLEMGMKYNIDRNAIPTRWFIGAFQSEGEGIDHTQISLMRDAARTTGDVYVEKIDGRWYISEVQADFTRLLGAPGDAPPNHIVPGIPSWMIDTTPNGK